MRRRTGCSTSPSVPDVLVLIDAALRVHAPAALVAAGMQHRAAALRRLAPASTRNLQYASDVVHAAFVEARRRAHCAMAGEDLDAASRYGWAAATCHAAADACSVAAVAVVTRSPGLHWANAARNARLAALHVAARNAQEAERIAAEADACPIG